MRFRVEKMTFNGLTIEYSLEGSCNFIAWKDHIEAVLDDNGLLEYIKRYVEKQVEYNAHNIAQWNKDVAKVRRIILEGVHDHIVTHLHGKETHYAMRRALTNIFQNSSDHRKLVLKDKI